jgi:hypothetical protein
MKSTVKQRVQDWWAGQKQALRFRLRVWLGITEVEAGVRRQDDARRACIAMDFAMKHEEGFLILVQPSRGGDQVRVWRLPAGMPLRDQTDMIRQFEAWSRGEISLMDMPRAIRPEVEHQLREMRRGWPLQDTSPSRRPA